MKIQQLISRGSALALFIGMSTYASHSLSTSTALDEMRSDTAFITGDTREVEEVRIKVIRILKQALELSNGDDLVSIKLLISQVEQMNGGVLLGTFNADFITSFSKFSTVFNNLNAIQASTNIDTAEHKQSKTVNSVNLRNAIYTPLCTGIRADTNDTIIALGVFLVAEAIKQAAISGCGTVVVVLGNGGSPQSAVCSSAVAAVFQVARGVWEEFLICQSSIDSAEILGIYQRTEDIFNQVNEHDTTINNNLDTHDTAINGNLSTHHIDTNNNLNAHDTVINSNLETHHTDTNNNINAHDSDIKERLERVEGKLADAIQLLLTPQGKRTGWNNN